MESLKRPTKEDTDEDLLHQQELFRKKKTKPGVNVTKKYEQKPPHDQHPLLNKELPENEEEKLVIEEKNVIFDVQERNVSFSEPFTFEMLCPSSLAVDNLLKKDVKQSQYSAKKKPQSIFAQMLKQKDLTAIEKISDPSPHSILLDGSGLPGSKRDTELKSIHEENLAKISSMSEEEILHQQNQLKKALDPNIIRFIQNKRKKKMNISLTTTDRQTLNSQTKTSAINKSFLDEEESSGEILRKEGNNDCDALILERAMELENHNTGKKLPSLSSCAKSNSIVEIPEEAKKLLKGSNEGHWRNMNKIEKEKLEWMSDLPKANPINLKTGFTARFDFEGKLLAHDLETHTYKGLHHHGKEPEVAGYSLEELFLLARSTMQSQRITALHTISHILDNFWYGMMDGCFDDPLLPMMLEAGIVPLLRWALDDTSVTSVAATISAIHSLLISKADEICLQRTFCWFSGHLLPQLEPQDLVEPNVVLEELTDADLVKLDVVKAFLRMDIIPRFVYILQALQPPPLVCKLVIEICAHLAQHSVESAYQLINHPRMLNLLFEKFLPLNWQYVDTSKLTDTVNFYYPIPATMKLMRIIVSSSKELAIHLINKHDLVSNIIAYLTLEPNDKKVALQDIQELMIESLKTFQVLMYYDLAHDIFLELFPIFLKQMDFCLSLDLNSERAKYFQDFQYATHLFKALEAVAVASSKDDISDPSSVAIKAIFKRALTCLKKWLWQFPQDKPQDHGMLLLAANMNFVCTCYEKSHEGLICEVWEPCSETKEIFNAYVLPCIRSKVFKSLLEKLKSCSLLQNSSLSGNKRDSKTIVSLGSVLWKSDIVPLLKEDSPIPLLSSVLQLCIVQKQLFSDTDNQLLLHLLQDENVTEYLRNLLAEKLNVSNWFAKFECHLISQILKLASLVVSSNKLFWYKIAVSILPTFRTPQKYLVEDIFEAIIFNPKFVISTDKEIHKDILSKLPVIAKCYSSCFIQSTNSRSVGNVGCANTDFTSMASGCTSPFLLSTDWCYQPIFKQYYKSMQSQGNDKLMPDYSLQLISSLQWIYLCHDLCLPVLKDIPGAVDFNYLCMLFLLDEDFFHLPNVKILLEGCMRALLKYKKLTLTKINWMNLTEFDEMYMKLLNQFEAVSYGDELFGNFILFPLQQRYPSRWKKILLTEHSQVLQFLRVPFSKLFVPLQNYLEPFETEFEIIFGYCRFLLSATLTHVRCPLLYLMAIHHVNHFIFAISAETTKSQGSLLSLILQAKNKLVRNQILLYSEANISLECGFSVKQELSEGDQRHLSDIIGKPVML